jgi:hypothetical protein
MRVRGRKREDVSNGIHGRSALDARLWALGSGLSALGSRLSALGSRLSALGSGSGSRALGSRLSALGSGLWPLASGLRALGLSRVPSPEPRAQWSSIQKTLQCPIASKRGEPPPCRFLTSNATKRSCRRF